MGHARSKGFPPTSSQARGCGPDPIYRPVGLSAPARRVTAVQQLLGRGGRERWTGEAFLGGVGWLRRGGLPWSPVLFLGDGVGLVQLEPAAHRVLDRWDR